MARLSHGETESGEGAANAATAHAGPDHWVPCPWLPQEDGMLDAWHRRRHFPVRNGEFYVAALSYAQSLWLHGRPAQAILQLNKAWTADLTGDETELLKYPPPYRALVWLAHHAKGEDQGFMGNPVRHFQHLASRVNGPLRELRSWRAWACFWLMSAELEGLGYDRDGSQLAEDGLWIPSRERVRNEIYKRGWKGEEAALSAVFRAQNGF